MPGAGMAAEAGPIECVHCGAPCRAGAVRQNGKAFCCGGCQTVFELLAENGLSDFYRLAERPGVQIGEARPQERYSFLDEPGVRDRLLDFCDGRSARVTFHLPSIHCVACVWLLENLFKLRDGIGRSVVNFETRQVSIAFDLQTIRLSEVALLLATIGYEPDLCLDRLERSGAKPGTRSLYLKLGVAGFATGNIMLFSFCLYSGMDRFSAPHFQPLFGWVSLVLALPVLLYSASGYWQAAWVGLRQRSLTLEFPIALGLAALFGQSLVEVMAGSGLGYLDSLSGLVFFLLMGRVFQDRTYHRLSFDRDYKSFFPLAVKRLGQGREWTVPLCDLVVGDRLNLRHGELVPADSRVVQGRALIDYSFVTGESDPVCLEEGEVVYAGGRQTGGAAEFEIIKPVSQSYLTSLWSHETFARRRDQMLRTLLDRFSRGFTVAVLGLAIGAGLWWWSQSADRAIRAFTSVLIVACPCALALSAPFALGTAQRLLARLNVFVRNPNVLESIARTKVIVFDKTGTLTTTGKGAVAFQGNGLTSDEKRWIHALATRSVHPYSVRVADHLAQGVAAGVEAFQEFAGAGIAGRVEGHELCVGSAAWLNSRQVELGEPAALAQGAGRSAEDKDGGGQVISAFGDSLVYVAVDGVYRGAFRLGGTLRPQTGQMLRRLAGRHELVLLSGDNDRQRERFRELLGESARLEFEQSPFSKLASIEAMQQTGRPVMMVGDGLNDAGALRQSDVGVAVVEAIGAFSPASDVIMEARNVPALADIICFARRAVSVVWAGILLSLLYNVIGLSFAASGRLSPILCAILMPLSSISVVVFASAAVGWAARRSGLSTTLNPETKL